MTRIPYSPATDATPRDSDLDPHAHCRAREAALRAAIAAADRLAEACVQSDGVFLACAVCGYVGPEPEEPPEHRWDCTVLAYLAAREETR